jgi:hypothetical protein
MQFFLMAFAFLLYTAESIAQKNYVDPNQRQKRELVEEEKKADVKVTPETEAGDDVEKKTESTELKKEG